ncbi:MAG: hypothetical protein KGH87_02970 [Thaumarchaeota archaeon]|nr:hypothetical protein [Nitrososphaerota archaeon]MDE1838861.1 hypothetical protein [Nitrososphaerota archaeon]MDH2908147.1 hypothetical protein [Candidatus Nitrosotalea sp.]
MENPIIADNVVIVNPMVGNEIINGINDVLLSIILAAKLKNNDLNIT